MSKETLLEMESEKQEIKEFIESFKRMPKDRRRDIKYIMIGIDLAGGKNESGEENK